LLVASLSAIAIFLAYARILALGRDGASNSPRDEDLMGRHLAALLVIGATAAAWLSESSPSPWANLASADVRAFCADIRGVHPGMVDPQSPAFGKQVDRACELAAARAGDAASFLDWMEIMQALVTSFRDGHTGI